MSTPTRTRRRRPKVNLGGVAEISEKYGIGRTTISMWMRHDRHGWPKPLAHLSMGPVYDMDEVDLWFSHRVTLSEPPEA